MEKSLGVTEARQNFSELIDGVRYKGDTVILVKNGKPSAVMIPVGMFEQLKKERKELFEVFTRVQAKNADIDMSEDELMAFLEEVKHEVRNQSRTKQG